MELHPKEDKLGRKCEHFIMLLIYYFSYLCRKAIGREDGRLFKLKKTFVSLILKREN